MKLIKHASAEKLRGGFYTPEPIAAFILKWGMNNSNSYDILEPSCGDGMFLRQLKQQQYPYHKINAIEFDSKEAEKADAIKLGNAQVINSDFHLYCNRTSDRYDLVVGNPPYIRYQYYDNGQQQEAAKLFNKAGLKFTKLTNAWVTFIVGSSLLLKEKGKIGFVVPAELLQVSYAQQLRKYLAHFYNKINIISFKKLVFPEIQQEVVLLLCEKDNTGSHLIEHLELMDASDLELLDVSVLKSPQKKIDFKSNKWTFYFLEQKEIDFLESIAELKNIPLLGDFAKVEVGITTGSNNYFTVSSPVVDGYNLQEFAKPLVGRSVQVDSIVFTEDDWRFNCLKKVKTHLLVFPVRDKLVNHIGANAYISLGETMGIHKGYKTRIRDDWFVVPSIRLSEALFIRRSNIFPKLIANQAQAYTTDTMHRVFLNQGTNIFAFVASFYNSLSLAFAEVSGRSYGGGVLELMPSETAKILLPYAVDNEKIFSKIDTMMRDKKDIHEILRVTNNIILKEGYGLTTEEITLADNIWKKLSSRRLNRSK